VRALHILRKLMADAFLGAKILVTMIAALGGFVCAAMPHPLLITIWLICAVVSYFVIRFDDGSAP